MKCVKFKFKEHHHYQQQCLSHLGLFLVHGHWSDIKRTHLKNSVFVFFMPILNLLHLHMEQSTVTTIYTEYLQLKYHCLHKKKL